MRAILNTISRLLAGKPFISVGFVLVLFALILSTLTKSATVKSFSFETPPPFGYMIGDLIEHNISLSVAKSFVIIESLLPKPGPINNWLELRDIQLKNKTGFVETQYRIKLVYQPFRASGETETLVIPAFNLQLRSSDELLEFPVPNWEFSYGPLIPKHISNSEITIRPPAKPKLISVTQPLLLLSMALVGLVTVLLYLAWLNDLLPLIRRNLGPFSLAYRQLKKFDQSSHDKNLYRSALRIIHRAFDDTAGKTVFNDRLENFFDNNPDFRSLQKDTVLFFEISREIFFSGKNSTIQTQYPLSWLMDLCRRFRAHEC